MCSWVTFWLRKTEKGSECDQFSYKFYYTPSYSGRICTKTGHQNEIGVTSFHTNFTRPKVILVEFAQKLVTKIEIGATSFHTNSTRPKVILVEFVQKLVTKFK